MGVLLAGAQSPTASQANQVNDNDEELQKATFAGGCFWCMEPPFDKLDGVVSTTSGYIGGHKLRPTYEEVSAGVTGHAEAVEILYHPSKISYTQLLEVFWPNIDPLTPNRQFCDGGSQYRSAIFYHDDEQERLAGSPRRNLNSQGGSTIRCDGGQTGRHLLPRRGIPPGLLQEESDPLQVLPIWLWSRQAPRAGVGAEHITTRDPDSSANGLRLD